MYKYRHINMQKYIQIYIYTDMYIHIHMYIYVYLSFNSYHPEEFLGMKLPVPH